VKQRHALRLILATITVAAAGACVASANLWIAVAMVVCALATATRPLAKKVSQADARALLESLRVSRDTSAPAVKAVVGTKIIFVEKSAISGEPVRGSALLFRDEIDPLVWRELATLLRHQVHPSPELIKVDRIASFRLGKSSDLCL